MKVVDLTKFKEERKFLKAKLLQLDIDEKISRRTQIDKFIIENRTHNCKCGDDDDLEIDATSCDVQCLMLSNGYVLYDGGDMEWHKPKDIKNCKELVENLQVLDFPDFDHIHTSEGCLRNYENFKLKGYVEFYSEDNGIVGNNGTAY